MGGVFHRLQNRNQSRFDFYLEDENKLRHIYAKTTLGKKNIVHFSPECKLIKPEKEGNSFV